MEEEEENNRLSDHAETENISVVTFSPNKPIYTCTYFQQNEG